MNDRISKHFSDAKRGRKQELYEDIRRYGREMFTYKVIEEVTDSDKLDDRERYWIDKYIKSGFTLYNNEFGGRKNIDVPYKTRIKMAVSKGTKPFVVYDTNYNFIGRFEKLSDANKRLGTFFTNDRIKQSGYSHKYIAIYEQDFTYQKLSDAINSLDVLSNGTMRKHYDNSGKNNAMYQRGKHFYVYDNNHLFFKEYFSYSDCIKDLSVSSWSIKKYMDTQTPCKRGYYFYSTKKTEESLD